MESIDFAWKKERKNYKRDQKQKTDEKNFKFDFGK